MFVAYKSWRPTIDANTCQRVHGVLHRGMLGWAHGAMPRWVQCIVTVRKAWERRVVSGMAGKQLQ